MNNRQLQLLQREELHQDPLEVRHQSEVLVRTLNPQ